MIEFSPYISLLTWDEAGSQVQKNDPELYRIIDKIGPSADLKLYKMTYHFGDTIYADGKFHVPDDMSNSTIPLAHASIPISVKQELAYQPMPLGFLLTKSLEVYRTLGTKISPIAHRNRGLELGIWETFSPPVPNIVTAGARSIFMLPKISDNYYHNRLKAVGVKSKAPINYFDQHQVFIEIAHHASKEDPWKCDILFFDETWKKRIFNNEKWKDFKLFLFEKGFSHSQTQRVIGTFETALNNFFKKIQTSRIKYAPHTIDLFKHLLLILSGSVPAFKPIEGNNDAAPVTSIYNAYLNIYDLKNYYPTIVYADYLNLEKDDAVYYSLKTQAHLETGGHQRQLDTFKKELIELIDLVERFTAELKSGNLGEGNEYLLSLFNKVRFTYFHYDNCSEYGILNTSIMHTLDSRLCFTPTLGNDRIFSDRNPFVGGCVKVSTRNGNCVDDS